MIGILIAGVGAIALIKRFGARAVFQPVTVKA